MNIILTKDIARLGSAGDTVKVKDGYGRNYLLPQGFALISNEKNSKEIAFHKRRIQKKVDAHYTAANEIAKKLESVEISITKKVGTEGKLFGSVTNREIAGNLKNLGFEFESKNIIVADPIKKAGVYEIAIKLFREVRGNVKLLVVGEEETED